jgi:hypothetical protein
MQSVPLPGMGNGQKISRGCINYGLEREGEREGKKREESGKNELCWVLLSATLQLSMMYYI